MRDSEIQADGSLREGWVPADTEGYWVDAPAFGGWGPFIRAFPEALDAAGLQIPERVILDDVSDPDGTGLPAGQRPWQPPRPLAPDPAHLARLFTPGTRLSYDITGGLFVRDAAFARLDCGSVLGDAITAPVSDPGSGTNLIAYHSGWGDGAYPTWIGRAADGDVVCFVADMLLMPDNAAPEAG